jgi:hypothetical protein
LLEYGDKQIVVSTVGDMHSKYYDGPIETVGYNRYYETMAFAADRREGEGISKGERNVDRNGSSN